VSLTACPVKGDYQDDDWADIVYDFSMNFSIDSARAGYQKIQEKEKSRVSRNELRAAGYTEEDIARGRF
jgi:hypothetical protein